VVKDALSPKELARAIGVSESSMKRWVDDGQIRATRTAGGHRRIPLAEAIRFARQLDSPLAQPELLGLPDIGALQEPMPDRDSQAQRMYELLHAGEDRRVRALASLLYLEGQSIAEISDRVFSTAMHRMGELWHEHDRGIFIEHRATDICIAAINQLRLMVQIDPDAPVAVGGAPTGDPYLLPSMMAAATLEDQGFRAVNLGPETPVDALHQAAVEAGAMLVWVSISALPDPKRTEQQLLWLADALSDAHISLIVGGRARQSLHLTRIDKLHDGGSMGELVAFARGLRLAGARAAQSSTQANGESNAAT